MDKFLQKPHTRSGQDRLQGEDTAAPATPKMATAHKAAAGLRLPPQPGDAAQGSKYAQIAEKVASLLHPNILVAVEQTLTQALSEIRKEVQGQAKQLTEVEQRVADLEDEVTQCMAKLNEVETADLDLRDKANELENHSQRNNLYIIGLPELFVTNSLLQLCQTEIPKLLGINPPYTVERYRLGKGQSRITTNESQHAMPRYSEIS